MRKILASALFLLVLLPSFSQDLIVTSDGDSINCKITRIKADNIYFTFSYNGEIRSTLLPKSSVNFYQADYYEISEVPADKVIGNPEYRHLTLSLMGGYAYRTARLSDDIQPEFRDYIKNLKSGYHLNGNLTYYVSELLGIGLIYDFSNASNSMDDIYLEDEFGNRRYGMMSDDIKVTFIGPTLSSRLMNRKKTSALLINLSLGYMGYVDEIVLIDRYRKTGGTIGMGLDFGYDIILSEKISLGFQLSLLSGTLYSYYLDDGITKEKYELEPGEYDGLSRMDLSVGLRFIL